MNCRPVSRHLDEYQVEAANITADLATLSKNS